MSAELRAVALAMAELGAVITEWPADDLGAAALSYAASGWEVFPLHGKEPAIAKREGGNGVLDATCDLMQVAAWWTRYPQTNIGGRVPAGVVVVDIDPRNGGDATWRTLLDEHGAANTHTLTAYSGRGDGGHHRYYRHPGGNLRGSIGDGLDVKTHAGYCVLPPSIHPDSGRPYRWDDPLAAIHAAPRWLAATLRKQLTPPRRATARASSYDGDSVADWYTATRTWGHVLEPHGWLCVDGDGDEDGSCWVHPLHTSPVSATVKHGCLFVYSPNTAFEVTGAQDPHGYTRFRAFAVLDHGGDLSAAARAAMTMRGAV